MKHIADARVPLFLGCLALALGACEGQAPAPAPVIVYPLPVFDCLRDYVQGQLAKMAVAEMKSETQLVELGQSAAGWCTTKAWLPVLNSARGAYQRQEAMNEMESATQRNGQTAYGIAVDTRAAYLSIDPGAVAR